MPTLIPLDLGDPVHAKAWEHFQTTGHPLVMVPGINGGQPDDADHVLRLLLAAMLRKAGCVMAVPRWLGDPDDPQDEGDPNGSDLCVRELDGYMLFDCDWGGQCELSAAIRIEGATYVWSVELQAVVAVIDPDKDAGWKIDRVDETLAQADLEGTTFCFTGFRDEAMATALQDAGAEQKSGVSKKLTWLVANRDREEDSCRAVKARALGVRIVPEREMRHMLGLDEGKAD